MLTLSSCLPEASVHDKMRLKQHVFFFSRRRHFGSFIPEPAAPASCHPAAAPGTACPQSSAGEEGRGSSRLVTQITELFIIIITRPGDIRWSCLPVMLSQLSAAQRTEGLNASRKTSYVCTFENKESFFFFFYKRLHIQHVLGKGLETVTLFTTIKPLSQGFVAVATGGRI